MTRAIVARWWRTDPFALRHFPLREYRMMAEFKTRVERAEDEAREAVRRGDPVPSR